MKLFIHYIIYLFISLLLLYQTNILNIFNMYKSTNRIIFVVTKGGLGNRLMSFAGIIVLSIYFKSKPYCIIINII